MTETSFTPGRWFAMGCDVKPLGDKPYICWTGTPERENDEARANANLIAAAPELYQAVLDAQQLLDAWSDDWDDWEKSYKHGPFTIELKHIDEMRRMASDFETVLRKARGEGGF